MIRQRTKSLTSVRWGSRRANRYTAGVFVLALAGLLVAPAFVRATDYSSSNFIIRDPVISPFGGLDTSGNLELRGSLSETATGQSTSTNFNAVRSGFLYFPIVSTPVLSTTPGDQQITVRWSPAIGSLGWNVGSYSVGQAVNAGGPYAFTALGNVFMRVAAGLANGARYYFVVRAHDAFSVAIATSTEVSDIPSAPAIPPAPPSPPAAPSAPPAPPAVEVPSATFTGRAYPNAPVTVLRDGSVVARSRADLRGNFSISLDPLPSGFYNFALAAEDSAGRRGASVSLRVEVIAGQTTSIAGIFLPPTLDADHLSVRQGDPLQLFGESYPDAEVAIFLHDELGGLQGDIVRNTRADRSGRFRMALDSSELFLSAYSARGRASADGETSSPSAPVFFVVGERTIPKVPGALPPAELIPGLPPGVLPPSEIIRERIRRGCAIRADFNCDGRVDLIDFSILIFWWQKELAAPVRDIVDLTADGRVDLSDFSVLIYYWTG